MHERTMVTKTDLSFKEYIVKALDLKSKFAIGPKSMDNAKDTYMELFHPMI